MASSTHCLSGYSHLLAILAHCCPASFLLWRGQEGPSALGGASLWAEGREGAERPQGRLVFPSGWQATSLLHMRLKTQGPRDLLMVP